MSTRHASCIVLALLVLCAPLAHAIAPEGSWWNTTYNYRERIDIPSGASSLASGYAVSVTFNHAAQVTAGRSLLTGNDVRIVFYNGTTWVELDRIVDPTTTWNSTTTRIWFRTQAPIASGVTEDDYYLYYGNASPGAPPANAANIYSLYDEFNGTTLDTALWTSTGPSPVIISGGVLQCPNSCQLESLGSIGVNTIWEARVSLSATSGTSFHYWLASDAGNYNGRFIGFYLTGSGTHTGGTDNAGTTTTRTVTASTANTYRTVAFTRESTTTVRFYVNGTQQGTNVTTTIPTVPLPVIVRNSAGPGTTQNYEWVRVRPYRTNEPTLTMAGREQYLPIAIYQADETTWNATAGEVVDSSTSGLHGTALGGAVTANATPAVAGNPGTCRYGVFDGANDYAQTADNGLLDMTAALTVSAWIYPRAYGTELKAIVSKDTNFEMHLDNNGDVYYWWNDANGNTRTFTSTGAAVPISQWSHVAVTYRSGSQRIYINGVLRGSQTYTGALATNNWALQIGYDGASSAQPARYWNGYIDEVNIYSTALSQAQVAALMTVTHPCLGGAPHFVIGHDGFGINCAADSITVNVRDALNNPYTGYGQQITLDTGSGRGDWSLVSGGGALVNGTSNDGIATYAWAAADSAATFSLTYREGTSPINIDAFQSNDVTVRDDETEGLMAWTPSGFTVTSASLANPPGVIPAFASPQIAGTDFTVHIAAYGVTPTDAQCGVIEAYTGAKNVNFWSTYVNPGTGTRVVTINSGNIATSEGASSAQAVTFTNGQASVTARYTDAGLIDIAMKDITIGNPSLPTGIRGSTGNIVVRPATFVLSTVTRTSDGFVNPAAANATGAVFIAAGQPFTTTVTALASTGVVTPNFGRESTPESVALLSSLVLPSGGQNPAVASTAGFASFVNGVATGTDFSWPEVGVITLTPHIRDGDYLGAGDVLGTTTGDVGRFTPANFATAINLPQFQTACSTGVFTYIGQPFVYATAPVLTVTARAAGGTTTQNYRGAFFKLTNTSLTSRTYTAVTGTLDTTGLPAITGDPAILDLANGLGTLTFSAGTGLAMARTTPIAPFDAQISLSINVLDTDGVAATNPVSFTNIAFNNGAQQRYGRIAFRNAVGSELLNLPVPMRAEYFLNATTGFVQHSADTCTTGITLALGNYGGNLNSGETCLINDGSPGAGGVWCAAGGLAAQQFKIPPVAGDFVATLRAPGANNDGTVTVTTVVPSWLRFDWNAAVLGSENPSGIATFGIFKGDAKRIFQTEK